MSLFKTQQGRKPNVPPGGNRQETLRQQRLAHEESQKAAGLWGDMSVGLVRRDNDVFVHHWKGHMTASLSELAAKKPREMTPADHDALLAWLKAGRYEGFVQSFVAWNVNADEAARIRKELLEKHLSDGRSVINPAA